MNDVKYAIPSHRRPNIIDQQTLPMLDRNGVPMHNTFVFVSDEEDMKNYRYLEKRWHCGVVYEKELKNIVEKFNYVHNFFPKGERVVFIEDDIEALSMKGEGDNKLEKFEKLPELALQMFKECEKQGTKLWGISSNANPFYMKNQVTSGFKFVVANLFGFVSTLDPFLEVSQVCKSDYERTMLYFIKFGGIVRMDGVCAMTKNYKNAGGLQEIKDQRDLLEKQSCEALVKRFPHLVEINAKKTETSMYMELKLKQIRKANVYTDWMGLQKQIDQELRKCTSILPGTHALR